MNKEDLKNGMIIQTRDGVKYLYCEGVIRSKNVWSIIDSYRDDLTSKELPEFDIIKVYKDSKAYSLGHLLIGGCTKEKLIWERITEPILSEEEVNILNALYTLGYKYIARDQSNSISAYVGKLYKGDKMWHSAPLTSETYLDPKLFKFVTWKDNYPVEISNLLSVLNGGVKK